MGLSVDASWHIDELIAALEKEDFEVEKREGVCLLTIRNCNDDLYERYVASQETLVRQINFKTVRVVLPAPTF